MSPEKDFLFLDYKAWHADRGGLDKVSYNTLKIHFLYITYFQGGGGMSIYYDETLQAHEHIPTVPDNFSYLRNERQWLPVQSNPNKIAFLRCV